MIENPARYPDVKKRILQDFKRRFPNIKLSQKRTWWGCTRFNSKGKASRVTGPSSDGPTALKVWLHEYCHAGYGPIHPISLGEWMADKSAIVLMRRYGVEPTDRTWDRIYDYQVKCVAKELKQGKSLPEPVAWMRKDAEIYNELGPQFWRKNVRDIRKIQERMTV